MRRITGHASLAATNGLRLLKQRTVIGQRSNWSRRASSSNAWGRPSRDGSDQEGELSEPRAGALVQEYLAAIEGHYQETS
jgi:hypothetical protein